MRTPNSPADLSGNKIHNPSKTVPTSEEELHREREILSPFPLLDGKPLVPRAWVGEYASLAEAKEVSAQIAELFTGRKVQLLPMHPIEQMGRAYASEHGLSDEIDPIALYEKVESKLPRADKEAKEPFELYANAEIKDAEIQQLAEKLQGLGLRSTYSAVAFTSHYDKFLSVQQGSFEVVPDTYFPHTGTHFAMNFSAYMAATLHPFAANSGPVKILANGEVKCTPGTNATILGMEYVGRNRWAIQDPQSKNWVSAIGGANQPLRAAYPWRHAWEVFKQFFIRKVRIKAISHNNKYWQFNPGNSFVNAYHNLPNLNNTVFTLLQFPRVDYSAPLVAMFIAPDNSYVETKMEFINDPNNHNNNGPAQVLKTGWNKPDRHEAFEIHYVSGGIKLRGPIGWVYIGSNGKVYGDGSPSSATMFQFEYV